MKQLKFEDMSIIGTPVHYWIADVVNRKHTTIDQDLSKISYSIDCGIYICGKGGNHIWISDKTTKERKIIIYYK